MSSVEVGKPFKEEQQLEKKQQGEGCRSEEEEAKPRKMGDEAEDAFEYEGEGEDEEMDEAEVEQPEKKRPGEGEVAESDEEEPKRQKVEDDKDHGFMSQSETFHGPDFLEDDSDKGNDVDFSVGMETNPDSDPDDFAFGEANEDRNCLEVTQCGLFQHKTEYRGISVFELYKVKLILNEELNQSLSGKLYGAIEIFTSPENPEPISYFSAKKENAFPIHLTPDNNNINLPLSFLGTKALTVCYNELDVKFTFTFENDYNGEATHLFEEGGLLLDNGQPYVRDDDGSGSNEAKTSLLFRRPNYYYQFRKYSCYLRRKLLAFPNSDIIRVAADYGIYNGAWATVDVKILKEDVTKYYGFIFARPCIFISKIRLLSIQHKDQMRELPKSGDVTLARQVVGVPIFCSLIISAWLFDQDGNEIVRDKTFFKVLHPGESDGDFIGQGNVRIAVKWKCEIPGHQFKLKFH